MNMAVFILVPINVCAKFVKTMLNRFETLLLNQVLLSFPQIPFRYLPVLRLA